MTRASVEGVPNQPKTPQRSVRVPDEVWRAAKERAEAEGNTLSDVLRQVLDAYGRGEKGASF